MVKVEEVPVEAIEVPRERARSTLTDEQLAELEASIKTHGFTVPILVSPLPDGKYRLVDGEHRLAIARKLGLKTVPAVVAEGDERKLTLLNILANTARGTQNPMDVSLMLKKALEAGASVEELAAATGHTTQWVQFYIALAELPERYQEALRTGKLKVGHIREAVRLPNPLEVDSALQSTLIHNWTVEELKYYVDRRLPELREIYKGGEPGQLPPPPSPKEAEEIVSYGNCLACRRKFRREDLRMPVICQDCYDFLFYFAEQMPDTRRALETLYKAYNFYMDALKTQVQPAPQAPLLPKPAVTPPSPASPALKTPAPGQSEIDTETLDLARKIKALREAGLI